MNPLFPAPYVILLTVLLAAVSGWLAWRSARRTPQRIRLAITGLRIAGTAILVALALNWGRWRQAGDEQDRHVAVLVDASASMATDDVDGTSRWTAARAAAELIPADLIADRRVRIQTFTDRPVAVSGDLPDGPSTDGTRTDILGSVEDLLNTQGANGLAGIVVISDGRQLGGREHLSDTALHARSLGVPVIALPLGGEVAARDLLLSSVRRHYVTFMGQAVDVQADVENRNLGPHRVVVHLRDGDGKELAQKSVDLDSGETKRVLFTWQPPEEAQYVDLILAADGIDGETNAANNEDRLGVSVLRERIRVLMLEGQPFWDSKFLAQLIREHANFDYHGTYRVSQDRVFRVHGEDQQADAADTPVFPATDEELRNYDLVILGRGMEYFLDTERAAMLASFVRDHGGGVIFSRGKSYDGDFPALAEIEPATWGPTLTRELRWHPTERGVGSGLFGDMLPGPDAPIWRELPPLTRVGTTQRLHAFTQVLAVGREGDREGRDVPLVLMRRYGQGMVLTVTADNFWQWDFFPSNPRAKTFYRDFWTQVLQWATTYADYLPGQDFALRLDVAAVDPGEPVRIRVARRHDGDPGDLRIVVRRADGSTVASITPNRLEADSRQYLAVYSEETPGTYRLDLQHDGKTVGRQLLQIVAPPNERDDLSADPDFLATLAGGSGGQVLTQAELADVIREMLPEETVVDPTRRYWQSQWTAGWCLTALLLLICGEVFLRRRNGLL